MDKADFFKRFEDAITHLYALTNALCYNELSPVYKFTVAPNTSTAHVALDDTETAYIKTLHDAQGNLLTIKEVLNLIHIDERSPYWINMAVYEAKPDVTIIELLCARRLRKAEDLSNKTDKYPPFHILAPVPPQKNAKINNKFDVNWRTVADKQVTKGFIAKFKGYFS